MDFQTPMSTIPSSLTSQRRAIFTRLRAVCFRLFGRPRFATTPPFASVIIFCISSTNFHAGAGDAAPAWMVVEDMQKIITDANGGVVSKRGLPNNLKQTALKRINMALRWLVRDDGIVDMGVWKSIPKSKLYIPLDVHVGNTARDLGLLTRKQDDRKAVEELTSILRTYRPDDPAYYDYALFGIGVNGKETRPKHV